MSQPLYYLAYAIAATCFLYYLAKKGGYTELPFMISTLYMGWLLPQYGMLVQNPMLLPEFAYERTGIMAILVFLGAWLGWQLPNRIHSVREIDDRGSTLLTVIVLTGVGAVIQALLITMAEEIVGPWTGPITMVALFSEISYLALAFSFLLFLRCGRGAYLILTGVNLFVLLPAILFARRAAMLDMAAIMGISLWFVGKRALPRLVVLVGLGSAIVVVNAIGDIRKTLLQEDTAGRVTLRGGGVYSLGDLDYASGLEKGLASSEVLNAVYSMAAVSENVDYNYGAAIWNDFVQRYVPGQLVGFDLKQSLRLGNTGLQLASEQFRYYGLFGVTSTGLADSFQMFWFFGWVIFYLIGRFVRLLYDRASSGDLQSQVFYVCSVTSALQSFTHDSTYFVVSFPFVAGLVWFVMKGFKFGSGNNCRPFTHLATGSIADSVNTHLGRRF